jgi:positive regulator of sigma E activity
MKPTVPETGRVIRVDGEMVVVLLNPEKSCKGCGAAAIGLCKPSGGMSTLTVKNTKHAVPGDTVTVALDKSVQRRGFLLAYVIPVTAFLCGTVLGYIIGRELSVPGFEVIGGFFSLITVSFFSLFKLKKLDRSSSMTIKEIVSHHNGIADNATASTDTQFRSVSGLT